MYNVFVWIASLIVPVIVLMMMIQVVRYELAVTGDFSRNDQMGFMKSVGINSWNLLVSTALMGKFYCVKYESRNARLCGS